MIPRILIGTFLGIAGLVFYLASGYVLVQTFDAHTALISQSEGIAKACRDAASHFGKVNMRYDRSIDVDFGEVSDPRQAYESILSILALCPYSELDDVCIGVGCQQPNTALPRAKLRLKPPTF